MNKIYDVIIVGAGPAGITAGIYASRRMMDCLILTGDIGGQTIWSGAVENYTGYQIITGANLAVKFEEHIKKYKVNVNENETVTELLKEGNYLKIKTVKAQYLAKTVIISSGKRSRELNVPGEEKFRNKGVAYCATCDGPVFAGKTVAIAGGGNSALDAALQLKKIAKKIYIINNVPSLGGDDIMKEKIVGHEKVTVFNNTEIIEIFGDNFVKGIKIKNNGKEQDLKAEGIFVEIGLIPNSGFASGINKNEKDEIIINCQTETNIPGVFAAGDVTNVVEKQIIIAAGEGAKAALQAFRYLSLHND
ncbi:MAG: FAD-dependent oxidoreductase [Candidatus Omnitrophota bacterium]